MNKIYRALDHATALSAYIKYSLLDIQPCCYVVLAKRKEILSWQRSGVHFWVLLLRTVFLLGIFQISFVDQLITLSIFFH